MDITTSIKPIVNETTIHISSQNSVISPTDTHLKIALITDLHVSGSVESLINLETLMQSVTEAKPDLILFGGDYAKNPEDIIDLDQHRTIVATAMAKVGDIPTITVLGNHENWTTASLWVEAFLDVGITVLDNAVKVIPSLNVCIRGFGDYYSGQFSYVDFPIGCDGSKKISLTHDPAAAFDSRVSGLVLAGHTHCGQISLPLIGPLWVPSEAPRKSHCGLYRDARRQVFVSSGVGTSLLPIRFGAQAQWDLITIY